MLPPESGLPGQAPDPLAWTEVAAGPLGLTLEWERLPFREKAGAERKIPHWRGIPAPGLGSRNNDDDT